MSFEPVFLDEPLGNAASMTFLRHANRCMRSGFLYAKHRRRGVQTVEMVRGSAFHAVMERSINAMVDAEERELPPELAKGIVNEVIGAYPLPMEEHDYVREAAWRWASQFRLRDDERVVAVERLFVLELAGWEVRCKVDFAAADDLNRLYVADWKSGRGAPSYDEIARKRPDAEDTAPAERRMAAKAFQLVVYVLAVVFGRPVTVETIGVGEHESTVEVPGEQVARGCQEAIAEYVFPGIESSDGLMLRRTVGLTRLEMLEYRESLETLLARVGEAERSGDWPAVVSDAACGECPCSAECPIPVELRDHAGTINTVEEAREALQVSYVRSMRERALRRELRKTAEAWGGAPIRFGGRVVEFVPRESVEVRDKPAMYAAIAEGMPVEVARERFERVSRGTSFVERDLTEDELAAASEPSVLSEPDISDVPPGAGGSLAAVDGEAA